MRLSKLVAAVDGALLCGRDVDVVHVTHDSRDVRPGTLFVGLPGRRFDGAAFVPAAMVAGAVAVALDEHAEAPAGVPVVRLETPRRSLAHLAAALQGDPARQLDLVGLTGTNGKSTVAWLLAEIAQIAEGRHGLVGTIEHRAGGAARPAAHTTPEAPAVQALLAEMVDNGVRVAVMEVSSIGLAEHRLEAVTFAAAAFLNLSPDHLDYHGDMATYGAEKRRLFTEHLRADAPSIINVDDAFGAALADDLSAGGAGPVYRLSMDAKPFASGHLGFETLELDAGGLSGRFVGPRGVLDLRSPLVGRFNAANVATAAALAQLLDLPDAAIVDGLARTAVPGRMQSVADPRGVVALVDYAHSPDAIERVLATLRPLTSGRLWCVFGCGGDRDASKRAPMGRAAAQADCVVLTSDNPRSEDPAMIAAAALAGCEAAGRPEAQSPSAGHTWVMLDRRAAIRATIAAASAGDTVLVAGKGHETYQETNGVRRTFDDVAEVTAAIAAVSA